MVIDKVFSTKSHFKSVVIYSVLNVTLSQWLLVKYSVINLTISQQSKVKYSVLYTTWSQWLLVKYSDLISQLLVKYTVLTIFLFYVTVMAASNAFDKDRAIGRGDIGQESLSTLACHVGSEPSRWHSSDVVPPISLATTFLLDDPADRSVRSEQILLLIVSLVNFSIFNLHKRVGNGYPKSNLEGSLWLIICRRVYKYPVRNYYFKCRIDFTNFEVKLLHIGS